MGRLRSDLIVGHTDGTLSFFKNIAASESVPPVWELVEAQLEDMTGTVINTDGNAAPFIYDIDKDGKKDLIIGDIYGYVRYYRNVYTTTGSIKLQLINTQLGHAKADPTQIVGCFSTPFIGKIDSSGTEYLLMGSNSGLIYQYTGFQSGDTTATYTLVSSSYSYIDTMYNQHLHPLTTYGLYGNLRSALTVGDVDNSGKYAMIVGNVKGGVEFYKNKIYTAAVPTINNNANGGLLLYPNPVSDILNISWDTMMGSDIQISIVNLEGQILGNREITSAADHTTMSIGDLPPGLYVCIVQNGVRKHYGKFTVIR
jgi:hypothetical protein